MCGELIQRENVNVTRNDYIDAFEERYTKARESRKLRTPVTILDQMDEVHNNKGKRGETFSYFPGCNLGVSKPLKGQPEAINAVALDFRGENAKVIGGISEEGGKRQFSYLLWRPSPPPRR